MRGTPRLFPFPVDDLGVQDAGLSLPRSSRSDAQVERSAELLPQGNRNPFNFESRVYEPHASSSQTGHLQPSSTTLPSVEHSPSKRSHRRSKTSLSVSATKPFPSSQVSSSQIGHDHDLSRPHSILHERSRRDSNPVFPQDVRRRHVSDDLQAQGQWEWTGADEYNRYSQEHDRHSTSHSRPHKHRRTKSDAGRHSISRHALRSVDLNRFQGPQQQHSSQFYQSPDFDYPTMSPLASSPIYLSYTYSPFSYVPTPLACPPYLPSSPTYLHPELSATSSLVYSLVLSPSTARSRLDNPNGPPSKHSRTLLASSAVSGSSRILVHLGYDHTSGDGATLVAWVKHWGPCEIHRADRSKDFTILDILTGLYRYFHIPLSSTDLNSVSPEGMESLKRARNGRIAVEAQTAAPEKTEDYDAWKHVFEKVRDLLGNLKGFGREKDVYATTSTNILRLDVLVGYTVFAGLEVTGKQHDPSVGGLRVDLDLRLASALSGPRI
ncbi:hypothetical protein D9758_010172 [Tetrapyrgos nigripes]|uniref:DUF6699 domain-containing protein n=1 Tax=Tetrapyrgos nigripes TaxID=182062 RepID=A0A8H5FU33_9AGAR|nr:hypothetical protein D9758_010172 [Tetrapyrgos nigripes]